MTYPRYMDPYQNFILDSFGDKMSNYSVLGAIHVVFRIPVTKIPIPITALGLLIGLCQQKRCELYRLPVYLGDVEVESVFKVFRLGDDHQIETPAATEVGDDNRIDRHRRQKLLPRRLRRLT